MQEAQRSTDALVDPAQLFAAGPEALLVVREGRIACANERALDLVGRPIAGLDLHEVIPDWRAAPDDAVPFEAMLRCAEGELAIEVRVRELEDGVTVASLRDARALIACREAEAALADAEERYRGLVEQIPAVVYADDGNVTTYVNPQIEHILGVTPQAYRDDPNMWLRMVHPDDRETVESQSQAFIDGVGGDLADYRMIRPDGGIVWVRDRAYAHRDDDGRVLWEHGILFDVTELKEAEARIWRSTTA